MSKASEGLSTLQLDTEIGQGLITDVSIKRKIRNFVGITKFKEDGNYESGFDLTCFGKLYEKYVRA